MADFEETGQRERGPGEVEEAKPERRPLSVLERLAQMGKQAKDMKLEVVPKAKQEGRGRIKEGVAELKGSNEAEAEIQHAVEPVEAKMDELAERTEEQVEGIMQGGDGAASEGPAEGGRAEDADMMEQKSHGGEVLEDMNRDVERLLDEKRREVVVDGKRMNISELAANKELLGKLDFESSRTLANVDLLFSEGLLSDKEISMLARSISEDARGLESLSYIPRKTLLLLSERSSELNLKMEGLARYAVQNLEDPNTRQRQDLAIRAARVPGVIAYARRTGSLDRLASVVQDLAKSLGEDPDLNRLRMVGMGNLLDAAERGLFVKDAQKGKAEIVALIKQGMSSTENPTEFQWGVVEVRSLERAGMLTREEAEDIIKSNPNIENFRV